MFMLRVNRLLVNISVNIRIFFQLAFLAVRETSRYCLEHFWSLTQQPGRRQKIASRLQRFHLGKSLIKPLPVRRRRIVIGGQHLKPTATVFK